MQEAPPPIAFTTLSEENIEWIVTESLRGGKRRSLEALFNAAAFGHGHDPAAVEWAQWPTPAVVAWDKAVALYRERARVTASPRSRTKGISSATMWAAMESVVPPGSVFPAIPYVKPADIARHLPVGPRAVPYWLKKLGWRLAGQRKSRRVADAPCIGCGRTIDAKQIRGRKCRKCVDQIEARGHR